MAGQSKYDRDRAAVRARNSATCIEVLRDRRTATLAHLAAASSLSRPTIESILGELQAQGLVAAEDAPATSRAGRPARRYTFLAHAGHVVGVDLGLAKATAVVSDLSGAIVGAAEEHLPDDVDAFARLGVLPALVDRACAAAGIRAIQLRSAVIAVSGIVDDRGRVILSDLIPEWTGVDLRARIAALLPCPVSIENDVKVAAIAEQRAGAARLADDVVFVKVDRFVSAAIILDGRLHHGHGFAAGEIGVLEEAGWEADLPSDVVLPENRRALVERAAAGDSEADRILVDYTRKVARSIALVTLTIDPGLVVIGGGVSEVGEPLLDRLRVQLGAIAARRTALPPMVGSTLGGHGVVVGALIRALEVASVEVYGNADVTPPPLTVDGGGNARLRDEIGRLTRSGTTTTDAHAPANS